MAKCTAPLGSIRYAASASDSATARTLGSPRRLASKRTRTVTAVHGPVSRTVIGIRQAFCARCGRPSSTALEGLPYGRLRAERITRRPVLEEAKLPSQSPIMAATKSTPEISCATFARATCRRGPQLPDGAGVGVAIGGSSPAGRTIHDSTQTLSASEIPTTFRSTAVASLDVT